MKKQILETEIPTNIACPDCGARVWTDNDIEFCKGCSWSRAVAVKPVHYNQHTRGGKQPKINK
jgi:hypothetical protein